MREMKNSMFWRFLNYIYSFTCNVYVVCVHTHNMVYMWRSEDDLQELALSFHLCLSWELKSGQDWVAGTFTHRATELACFEAFEQASTSGQIPDLHRRK